MTFALRSLALAERIATEFKDVRSVLDGILNAPPPPRPLFTIWAEESGGLSSNAYEWSWGNGATGDDIGIPLAVDCELIAVTFNAESAGSSLTMRTLKNNVNAYVSFHSGQNSVDTLVNPVAFAAGDILSFRTGTLTGKYTDARVCAWFREI